MLQSLSMKNVALIESATLSFTSGLNVLSGETGSGKSVVVDSLNFVLGGKADKTMKLSNVKKPKSFDLGSSFISRYSTD